MAPRRRPALGSSRAPPDTCCPPATVEGWVPQALRERAEKGGHPQEALEAGGRGPVVQGGERREEPQTLRGEAGVPEEGSRRAGALHSL